MEEVSEALTGRREGIADVIRVGENSEGSGGEINNPVVDICGDRFPTDRDGGSWLSSISESGGGGGSDGISGIGRVGRIGTGLGTSGFVCFAGGMR